jgi:hypothetical protein
MPGSLPLPQLLMIFVVAIMLFDVSRLKMR